MKLSSNDNSIGLFLGQALNDSYVKASFPSVARACIKSVSVGLFAHYRIPTFSLNLNHNQRDLEWRQGREVVNQVS